MHRRARILPRLSLALVVTLGATAGAGIARGAEPGVAVGVDYAASADCPGAAAFTAQVVARAPRVRVVGSDEHAHTLVVRIARRGPRSRGRLVVRAPDGVQTERAVEGDTCAEVVTALALIGAFAVDPSAASAAPEPAAPEPPAPAPSGPASATPSPAPPSAQPSVPPPPRRESTSREAALQDRGPEEPPEGRWGLAVGAHAGVAAGVAPRALLTVPLFFELEQARDSWFEPSARVRFERTGSGRIASSGATADFTWTAASLDACPVAWRAERRFGLVPCVRFEGGALEVTGLDVEPSRSRVRPWLDVGPVARGRAHITGPLFVEIEGAALVALVRDRFFVEPSTTVFRAPWLGFSASAGAGMSFW